jgi:four helix bundle protein
VQDFRNIDAWSKAHQLALDVYRTVVRARRFDSHVRSQLKRAALSIPSTIVEGCGHDSRAELARYVGIAIASASEVEYWLLVARDLGQLPPNDHSRLSANAIEIRRMLFGFRRRLRGE